MINKTNEINWEDSLLKIDEYDHVKTVIQNRNALLVGPRRVGKTTLMLQLHKHLGGEFIQCNSFDNIKLTPEQFIKKVDEFILTGTKYIYLDEITELPQWNKILILLYDLYFVKYGVRIIATGSSTTWLSGVDIGITRYEKIFMGTWNFDTYCKYKQISKTHDNFERYLGTGFPEAVINDWSVTDSLNKILYPLLKDDVIKSYAGIDINKFIRFVYNLSKFTNGEYSYKNDLNDLDISKITTLKYLDILEQSKLLIKVERLTLEGKRLKRKTYKYYLNPHIHLMLLGGNLRGVKTEFVGHIIESYWLFENYNYINANNIEIFYARSNGENNGEIDFLIKNRISQEILMALEFKYKDKHSFSDYENIMKFPAEEKFIVGKANEPNNKPIPIVDVLNYKLALFNK